MYIQRQIILQEIQLLFIYLFFYLEFFSCKPGQSLQGMELQVKETQKVETYSVKEMIDGLDSSKSGIFEGITRNFPRGAWGIFAEFLHAVWNDELLKDLKFARDLKLADVVPVFKKDTNKFIKNSNK